MKVQKYVLRQFAQLLPHDVEARRAFVQNGGLQFLQVCSRLSTCMVPFRRPIATVLFPPAPVSVRRMVCFEEKPGGGI